MAEVIKEQKTISGRRYYIYRIYEINASSSSYYVLDGVPENGIIRHFQSQLVDGTATTIQPKLGKYLGFDADSVDEICDVETAAAYVNISQEITYAFADAVDGYAGEFVANSDIYVYSQPDSGSDNDIETVVVIVEGMH